MKKALIKCKEKVKEIVERCFENRDFRIFLYFCTFCSLLLIVMLLFSHWIELENARYNREKVEKYRIASENCKSKTYETDIHGVSLISDENFLVKVINEDSGIELREAERRYVTIYLDVEMGEQPFMKTHTVCDGPDEISKKIELHIPKEESEEFKIPLF